MVERNIIDFDAVKLVASSDSDKTTIDQMEALYEETCAEFQQTVLKLTRRFPVSIVSRVIVTLSFMSILAHPLPSSLESFIPNCISDHYRSWRTLSGEIRQFRVPFGAKTSEYTQQ